MKFEMSYSAYVHPGAEKVEHFVHESEQGQDKDTIQHQLYKLGQTMFVYISYSLLKCHFTTL